MNRLSTAKRVAVISALVEGCSVRSTSRLTGVAKGTILRLLADVGAACARYQDTAIRRVNARRVQVDEIWSFVGAKAKNVTPENTARGAVGDVGTFVAIDADSKLVLSWLVGLRDSGCATEFMQDVAAGPTSRLQLTWDGNRSTCRRSMMPSAVTSITRCSSSSTGPPATARRATTRPGASGASNRMSSAARSGRT